MNRLFTFGCSYTSYAWSTWADILGQSAQEFQNWGMLGTGNQFIFNSVHECHQRNRLQPGDTVVVCWTNTMRDDRYTNVWNTLGNIYTQPLYDPAWIRKWITERGCLLRDLAAVAGVRLLLESTGVSWRFLSMVPIDQVDQYTSQRNPSQDLLDLYHDVVVDIKPSYWQVLEGRPKLKFDLHPSPEDHLYYLDQVLPEFVIADATRLQIAQETAIIQQAGTVPEYKKPNITRA
jgi:hypothetical protein